MATCYSVLRTYMRTAESVTDAERESMQDAINPPKKATRRNRCRCKIFQDQLKNAVCNEGDQTLLPIPHIYTRHRSAKRYGQAIGSVTYPSNAAPNAEIKVPETSPPQTNAPQNWSGRPS